VRGILNVKETARSRKSLSRKNYPPVRNVNTHIRHIYEKLQVNSIQEAVSTAIRKGIV
jgi:DNA-binding NarL/FixJ family response regulator